MSCFFENLKTDIKLNVVIKKLVIKRKENPEVTRLVLLFSNTSIVNRAVRVIAHCSFAK